MKRTRIQRANAAAVLHAPAADADSRASRIDYAHGWLDGHRAGTRDAQRRMARKFKQGLRLGFNA